MKKWLSAVIACVTMVSFAMTVSAAPAEKCLALVSSETVYLENGDSITTAIYERPATAETRGALREKEGQKTVRYNDANGTAFTYAVYGTFQYDGASAEAIDASDDYEIIQSEWRCASHSAYTSGASAKGSATFRKTNGTTKKLSATLTCSAGGKLR